MRISPYSRNISNFRSLGWTAAAVACAVLGACAQTPAQTSAQPRSQSSPAPAHGTRAPDPEQRDRQYQHAEALYLGGHYKEAAAAFDELSKTYPSDARIWLKYGNTLTKQGNLNDAATAFDNAASADPAQGNSSLNLALVRLEQAQVALDVALAHLAPNSGEHAQADALQRQLNTLLGAPERAPAH